MNKQHWLGMLCLGFSVTVANAQTLVEAFEYALDDELLAAWQPSANAVVTVSDSVAPRATGTRSMRVEFNFPSAAWATETVRGPELADLLSIASSQYLTFRLRGDPAFGAADFRYLYLYAYDDAGNFGRWGAEVPLISDWQVLNFQAGTIQQPWDSPGLPDLSRIVRFAFFQYGSQAALDPYTATIHLDELMVRDAPLTEFPLPSAPRELIDDFEGYADDTALRAFYTYQNSPAATITTASLQTPAPQGNHALKLAVDFAPGQYPWGSVRSTPGAPFSLPTNAVVSLRLKGDPALAAVADDGTTFWLSFYDQSGGDLNYSTAAAPVISSEWTTIEARLGDFWSGATVDIGNLVQWRILVEGWMGTAEQPAMSGTFYVDDVRITVPRPALTIVREGGFLKLGLANLTAGKTYELRATADFSAWNTEGVTNATSDTAEWIVVPAQARTFYQLLERSSP